MNIRKIDFLQSQYIKEEKTKVQIYLHHTAGNSSAINTAKYWLTTNERVATAFIISGKQNKKTTEFDGQIIQCFEPIYYAYHLGLKTEIFKKFNLPFKELDKISIGIELCNWGNLTQTKDGKFLNYVNKEIPGDEVLELETPFKKYKFWHKYTPAQIESTKVLLKHLCDKFNIDKKYNDDIFSICPRALKGENGIFTHNSVRDDKVDIYPNPQLIEVLKSL